MAVAAVNESHAMTYRSERFNASLRSLDLMSEGIDPEKCSWVSDRMESVERMLTAIDRSWMKAPNPEECLAKALISLTRIGKDRLVPTLMLIVRNGKHREDSIRAMCGYGRTAKTARKLYERHRQMLLEHFNVA